MQSKKAILILLTLLVAVILFHLAILLKFIPFNIAWGGRLQTDREMYVMETVSIAINLFLIYILLMKGQYLRRLMREKILDFFLKVFLVLFSLNTLGNLFAKTNFEKCFAIVTLVFARLILSILRSKESSNK